VAQSLRRSIQRGRWDHRGDRRGRAGLATTPLVRFTIPRVAATERQRGHRSTRNGAPRIALASEVIAAYVREQARTYRRSRYRRSPCQLLEYALHDASTDVISTSFLISRATTSTEKRAIKWPEQGGSRRISRRGTARTRAPNLNFPGFRNRNAPSESLRLSSIPLLISGSGAGHARAQRGRARAWRWCEIAGGGAEFELCHPVGAVTARAISNRQMVSDGRCRGSACWTC